MDSMSASDGYREDPDLPGFWFFEDLRIQADVNVHRFVRSWVEENTPRGGRVLDLGAGEGALALQLLRSGIDVSCTSWDGKCRVPVPTFEVDLDHPVKISEVGGQPFDVVCCIEVIEHVENPAGLLRTCRSLLKDGGVLLLSTPNVEDARVRLQWLLRGQPLWFSGEEVTKNRHISMIWRDQLRFLSEEAGFRQLETEFISATRSIQGDRGVFRSLAKRGALSLIRRFTYGDPGGDTRLCIYEADQKDRRTGKERQFY
jgi:2-polyprenyl-3-methyl-5-hydroxy-6-metoxy-1,4-benzoquinol methylase